MFSLDTLNDKQREAVMATDGPLLILAGAGSGKTRVLTHRAAYLIEEKEVRAYNILAITFTNKAAKEMRIRLNKLLPPGKSDVMVSTFHSLALRILFNYADMLGYDTQFEICDATDQKSLMKEVVKKLEVNTKLYSEKTLLNAISHAKDRLITPQQYMMEIGSEPIEKVIAQVYDEYQKTLKRNNSMDFDDLLMNTVQLFRKHPEVLDKYQDRFQYIMVDEYQDTNHAQFEMTRLLADKYKNICVVGDDDQSIYRFRGADIRNILEFEKHYPGANVIKLEQNYRSTGIILDAANNVIAKNNGRKSKSLWTENERGELISYKQMENPREEAMYVAETINLLHKNEGRLYGDFAILTRTNAQSKEIEDAFRLNAIDYELVKGLRFWDHKIIKDLAAYMLTVASGVNDIRCERIINVPKRGIGNTTVDKLKEFADSVNISLFEAAGRADEVLNGRTAVKVLEFHKMIMDIRSSMRNMTFGELLDEIVEVTGYNYYMESEADNIEKLDELKEYVDKLREALMVYQEETERPDIVDFMRQNGVEGNNLDKVENGTKDLRLTPEEEMELAKNRVSVMTMHNAKGLEFPYVFVIGMDQGIFPGYHSIYDGDPGEMEEERRLCYVAITRAMKQLYLTGAKCRMVKGETRYMAPSTFIGDIPMNLMDFGFGTKTKTKTDALDKSRSAAFKGDNVFGGTNTVFKGDNSFGDLPVRRGFGSLDTGVSSRKPVAVKKKNVITTGSFELYTKGADIGSSEEPDYAVGSRVSHVKFGEGTVTSLVKGSRDYEVTVDFDKFGTKRMFAGFAKLVSL